VGESENAGAVAGPKLLTARYRGIREREMMRASLAGNRQTATLGFAQHLDTARRTQVLAVHVSPGGLGEENISRDDHFLAGCRPTAQSQHGAPVALVHHAVAD